MDNTSNVVDIDWLANPIREAYDGSPAEIALAVLEAIRETHAIVPREPTEAMKLEGCEALICNDSGSWAVAAGDAYRAMIAAAEGGE